MANIPVSTAIDNLLKSTPSTTVTTIAALKVLGAATTGDASIVNADISATAAINVSKLSSSSANAGLVLTSTGGTGAPTFQAVAGNGDVVGPASATDNAIARFDTGTGKLLQNSLVTVSDAGAITTPQSTASVIPFYYATFAGFPVAGETNHGAIAHAHDTGAMYYSHGGSWVKMLSSAIGWFDSYDYYANGTTITHLTTNPIVGNVYRQSKTGSAAVDLSVNAGALVGIDNSLNYIGSSVATDGTNLDMTFEMSLTANATPMAVANIMPNISFNSKKIIGDDGGIGGIDGTLIHLNLGTAGVTGTSYAGAADMIRLSPTANWIEGMQISPNVRFQIRIQVSYDVMRITAFGRTIVYKDSRIDAAVGPTVYWWIEFAGNTLGINDAKATTRLHRMWAEAPILNDIYPDPQGLAATINSGSNLTYPANLKVLNNASGFDNGSPPPEAFLAGVGDLSISGRKARNHFFFNSATTIVSGNTITLASRTYTFVTTLSAANQVLIGANNSSAMTNLAAAINDVVVTAGSFVVGQSYRILSVGTTSFTAIGAADNNVGTIFTATGVGTGSGTANAGEGTLYGTGTTVHATVSAVAYPQGIEIIALSTGITQNTYACNDTISNGVWLYNTLLNGSKGVATIRPFATLDRLPLAACNYALSTSMASSASASNQTLTSIALYPWVDVGTVETFDFYGSFGANTYEKTVSCRWLGTTYFTSGALSENGTFWHLRIIRHKETTVSHKITFIFETDTFRKSAIVDSNLGETYTSLDIQATGTTAGDVTLRTGVGTLLMKP